jgi:hypothetical protein
VNYLDEIAERIRRRVDPRVLPPGDTTPLFRIYAVPALAMGSRVRPEDVHNAWVAWMATSDPGHRSLQPFAALKADVQSQDEPFAAAIRQVSAELGLS